jgi:hypothetical protein
LFSITPNPTFNPDRPPAASGWLTPRYARKSEDTCHHYHLKGKGNEATTSFGMANGYIVEWMRNNNTCGCHWPGWSNTDWEQYSIAV